MGHLEKPGPQWLIRVERRQTDEELEKHLLQDIAGEIMVSYEMVDEIEERCAVALNQGFEGLLIASENLLGQQSIWNLCGMSIHQLLGFHKTHPEIRLA